MNLLQALRSRDDKTESRFSFDDLGFLFGGQQYPLLNTSWPTSDGESPVTSYEQYAGQLLMANPVVFTAAATRQAVFSQARLIWQRRDDNGKVVDRFTDRRLAKFQHPWPGGTQSDLLARLELHASVAGNAFVRDGTDRLHFMRPDWCTLVLGSKLEPDDPELAEDATVLGLLYQAGGSGKARFYEPGQYAHYAPHPDPTALYRGMSWLTPVVREVQGDSRMTEHKLRFLDNAATPNLLVSFDADVAEAKVRAFKELMDDEHTGWRNAYKTLYLGGGADATVIGSDLQQLDFSKVQGKAETRILMAAGTHPTIVGASEGMQGSSLNAGNYNSAKRSFGDIRLQHMWINACSSLQVLQPPREDGVELWFDKDEIPFLQDDLKDTAEIQQKRAAAIRQLTDAGYDAESVVAAIENDDLSQLTHSGLFSVQLQPPNSSQQENALTITDPERAAALIERGWTVVREEV